MGTDLRLLVAIASYGDRNFTLLKRVIENYQKMPFHVHIVVLSEAPKNLGEKIEVCVGLPSKNPWSLPFAHKQLFADRVSQYDLFAYSEDDMEVTASNIRAFLDVTPLLGKDEIAGFLRYELDGHGKRSMPDVGGPFHWKPETADLRGSYTVAEFSNEHSAFYLLTQKQLQQVIASGGYVREPYEGKYDMLCTAATDPYTSCGFRKVICVSDYNRFLINHLSNRYIGNLGLPEGELAVQIRALDSIARNENDYPVRYLYTTKLDCSMQNRWGKNYYEKHLSQVSTAVPAGAQSILSVGCGFGETETVLAQRGYSVTAFPLDSVIGESASNLGVELVYGSFTEAISTMQNRKFDCIIISHLLHLQEDPQAWISALSNLLTRKGSLVAIGYNFEYLPNMARCYRMRIRKRHAKSYGCSGINDFSASRLKKWMRELGLYVDISQWFSEERKDDVSGALTTQQRVRNQLVGSTMRMMSGRFTSERWLVRGRVGADHA